MSAFLALSPDEARAALAGPARVALIREAAEAGLADAQALLGQMLLDGIEVERDPRAGFGWFMRGAAQDHLVSLNMVGRCYELGWGVAPDPTRATECYRVAAERGMTEGMYNYATQLALGAGVPEDKAAALGWFRRAAARGYAKAENFVGSFHEDGWAGARDLLAAAQCYKRAAEGGDFRGCFNHARMLVGKGRVREALRWIGQAATLGNPRFREQLRGWIEEQRDAELRVRGLAALDRC
ncbi:tetratricopeptide repeat protein [Sphingomonas bacterium]|uniref:tetratricopeptide repeat protein n=1 Tax=Sphingomonas bacterium TaxID=1895847 RepID=UPI0015762A3F|nr:tetratricopeptide repeat protein [Sphingomonas bacterium]